MTLTRSEKFEREIGFKLVGEMMWPHDGNPRRATLEEKALWARCQGFMVEIDLLEPVSRCSHPKETRVILRDKATRRLSVKCGFCNEYLMEDGRPDHA